MVVDPIFRSEALTTDKELVGGIICIYHIAVIGYKIIHCAVPSLTVGITCHIVLSATTTYCICLECFCHHLQCLQQTQDEFFVG